MASNIHQVSDNVLPTNLTHTIFLSSVNPNQVSSAISRFDCKKATIDIPNHLLKLTSLSLSIPLTKIYNESIESGIVPNLFKISGVKPIFKNGTVTDTCNYRPIAILSPFAKIFERLIYDQLVEFLENHGILYKYQFGFTKGHSTEQAILEFTDELKMCIDKGEYVL